MNKKIFVTRSSMPDYQDFIKAIEPLWDSHILTNMGQYHQKLEKELAQYLDVKEISLMVNGHMALEMAIQSFGFPEGSEVITTPFTFISTTHAIVRNHLKPVFCDIKMRDGTIDEDKIESLITEKTVAILPVHVYGNICNVDKISNIAYKYGLKVIYDAAHAFGEKYKGKGVGSFGDASIFSFHATKVFNTIEGGAVVTQDHKLYEKLYNLKNFGIHGEELVTDIGANAKMNEICSIFGLCNLKRMEHVIEDRQVLSGKYDEVLKNIDCIYSLRNTDETISNYAYYPIIVKNNRDGLYDYLRQNDIYTRKYFYPLTCDHACFKNKYKAVELPNARKMAEKVLALPIYEGMDETDFNRIIKLINEYYSE